MEQASLVFPHQLLTQLAEKEMQRLRLANFDIYC